jgi:hypothetical protein
MIAAFALWCGVLWRVRGGAWETLLRLPPGTTRARIAVAVLMGLALAAVSPEFGIAAVPLLFAGMALAGWGHAMDIGRVAGNRWQDAVAMSGWGLVVVLPSAAGAFMLGGAWWLLLPAGLLFGPIYAAAWHAPRLPSVPRFAVGQTEWAEVACGVALGAGLWMAAP